MTLFFPKRMLLVASLIATLIFVPKEVNAHSSQVSANTSVETIVFAEWEELVGEWRRKSENGSRLIDIERSVDAGIVRYTTSWNKGIEKSYVGYSKNWAEFETKLLELAPQSMRLIDFEVFDNNGETHFIGVWTPGEDSFVVWGCPTWTQFVETWQQFNGRGLSLVDIETLRGAQTDAYFGLFRESMTEQALGLDKDWATIAP